MGNLLHILFCDEFHFNNDDMVHIQTYYIGYLWDSLVFSVENLFKYSLYVYISFIVQIQCLHQKNTYFIYRNPHLYIINTINYENLVNEF